MTPKETGPAPAPENTPAAPEPKSSSSAQEQPATLSTSNLASAEDSAGPAENMVSMQDVDQPAEPAENAGWVETGTPGDNGVAVEKAAFLDHSAGVGLVPGLSRLLNRRVPNYKVDIVIFGSILSLALAGLWIEWRLPGRRPM